MDERFLFDTTQLDIADKLGDRTKYLGASEVPIVLGSLYLPQYGVTRWHLWAGKVGHPDYLPRDPGEEVELGIQIEHALLRAARKKWAIYTDAAMTIRAIPGTPIIAHLDAVGQSGNEYFPIECKTSGLLSGQNNGWSYDTIPWHVYHQVQTQIAALDAQRAVVIALVGGLGRVYHEYEVYRDDKVITEIIRKACDFWQYVETKTPPEEQPFDIQAAVRIERVGAIELPDTLLPVLEAYHAAKQVIAKAEQEVEQAKAKILQVIGNAERGYVGGWTVVAKKITQQRVDVKRLCTHFPNIYEKCVIENSFVQLRVKPPQEKEDNS